MTAAVEMPPVKLGNSENIRIQHGIRTRKPDVTLTSIRDVLTSQAGTFAVGLTAPINAVSVVRFPDLQTVAPVGAVQKGQKMGLREKIHHLLMGASQITSLSHPPVRARSGAELLRVAELAYDRYDADAERRMNG